MKTLPIYLALFFFFTWICADAAVYTVNNRPDQPTQYRDFNEAMALANHGDTIVIIATDVKYGSIRIDKSVTLIGQAVDHAVSKLPLAQSVYIDAPNVVVRNLACAYIYCYQNGNGALLENNTFTTIAFYEPCENITLINNTFNILDISGTMSNLMMFDNRMVDEPVAEVTMFRN